MAPNKFASMLHRNTNRLTLVLVYVLLEWILIALILLNSLFSYLIVKYTDFFGLKRPCVLCSRIDHGKDKRVRRDMICEEHALEISELGFCQDHQKLVKCSQIFSDSSCYKIEKDLRCFCSNERLEEKPVWPVLVENRDFHSLDQGIEQEKAEVAEEEGEDMQQLVSVELEMSYDDEYVSESLVAESGKHSATAPGTVAPVASNTCEDAQTHINNGGDHESVNSSQHSDIIMEIDDHEEAPKPTINEVDEESDFEAELESAVDEISDKYTSKIKKLMRSLNEVRAELLQERNDYAEASSQTMAMTTKLQEEKAALQPEASNNQRMTDEKIAFEQVAVFLLDESKLEVKLEIEQLQNELTAAATIEKLTMALNEAYAELEQERDDYAEASSQTMAMITKLQEEKSALQLEASQYQRMTEEKIAFDEEAVLLLDEMVKRREKENHELKEELELYKRRFSEQENMRISEEDHHQKNMTLASESVWVCCSSFGDQDSDGVSTEDYDDHQRHVDHHDEHPLVDSEDERLSILVRLNELEQKLVEDDDNIVEEDGVKCGIEEEDSS